MREYKRLAGSVIRLTILDLKNVKKKKKPEEECERILNRKDAKEFFRGNWFESLCEDFGFNKNTILKKCQKYLNEEYDD